MQAAIAEWDAAAKDEAAAAEEAVETGKSSVADLLASIENAAADAYGGDTQRALVAATASDSEKLKLAYLKYKETVPGAEDGGGSGSGSGSSARPGTAKSRGRPGSARPMSSSGRSKEEKRAAVGIGRLSDEMATASLSRDEIFPEPRGFVSRR